MEPLKPLPKPPPRPLESGEANVPKSPVVLGAGAKGLLIGLITPGLALNSGFNWLVLYLLNGATTAPPWGATGFRPVMGLFMQFAS